MTSTLPLATVHGGFSAPLTVLVVVAVVGYVLWSRIQGQPLKAKRLVVLPLLLTVIGIVDLTGASAPHLTATDIAFLVASVAISAFLGAVRGATIELYPEAGELWQRYRRSTVGLWIVLIASKLVVMAIAHGAGASAGAGTDSLLLSLGVSLLGESAIVAPRAHSSGLPFATDHKESDGHRSVPGRSSPGRSSPAPTNRFIAAAPARGHSSTSRRVDDGLPVPGHPHQSEVPDDARPWRSPSLSDGVSWLRHQIDPHTMGGPVSQRAPSGGPADAVHDDNRHGLTGPS
jgi:hypothetical protein